MDQLNKKIQPKSNKDKERNTNFSMWERYRINDRIKIGYEKYMEKKEKDNISNKATGQ